MATVSEYNQCVYTHDISDEGRDVEIFEQIHRDEWSCQHPAGEDTEYCPFHQSVKEKDDQVVVERFLEVVNTGYDDVDLPPQERFRFLGAEFGDFSLPLFTTLASSGEHNPAVAQYPIDLRETSIKGVLHWAKTTLRHDLLFDGAFVEEEVNLIQSTIEGKCSFVGGQFASEVYFDESEIEGGLRFDDSNFEIAVSLADCEVMGRLSLNRCHVYTPEKDDDTITVNNERSSGSTQDDIMERAQQILNDTDKDPKIRKEEDYLLDCSNATIGGGTTFGDATIEGDVVFEDALIKGETSFSNADISGYVLFESVSIKKSLTFLNATIRSGADFSKATVGGETSFQGATVHADISFEGAVLAKEDTTIHEANFRGSTINGVINFDHATIKGQAQFEKAVIKDNIRFKEATIEDDLWFEEATVEGDLRFNKATIEDGAKFYESIIRSQTYGVEFHRATIQGGATFRETAVERSLDFAKAEIDKIHLFETEVERDVEFNKAIVDNSMYIEGTTCRSIDINEASFGENVSIKAALKKAPVLTGIAVGGTLKLDFSLHKSNSSVLDLTGSSLGSIQIGEKVDLQALKFHKASIKRLSQPHINNIDGLEKWSLQNINFDNFDFKQNREVLKAINWNIHTLNSKAKKSLALNAVRDVAQADAEMLKNIIVGAPAVAHRIVDNEIQPQNLDKLCSLAAETVFTDEELIENILKENLDLSEMIEKASDDPAIKLGVIEPFNSECAYTQQTAIAICQLSERLATDGMIINAASCESVSTKIHTIAETVVDANPVVSPHAEKTTSEQIDTDDIPIDDLHSVMAETYSDPEDFDTESNPEIWEATYINARNAATDDGLNEVAAEFFLREKRFKRKRHAKTVRGSKPLRERATSAFNWISNLTMEVTSGYGERPGNVVLTSMATVGVFAGLYWAMDPSIVSGPFASLVLSFQSFLAFLLSSPDQASLTMQILTAFEGFLGAFLIALFVFTLTRSLNR